MDVPLGTPPVAGREYFVEADVFGISSASSIRFEIRYGVGIRRPNPYDAGRSKGLKSAR